MKALFIVGTRPEVIKLAPVILECNLRPEIEVVVCSTGQHRQMLDQAFKSFNISPDIDLGLMTENQSLASLSASALTALAAVLDEHNPDAVVVQGDTTTAMIGALSAFYHQTPIVHVEAGLRTWDRLNPYPEEVNRSIIDQIAEFCMAPTTESERNLIKSRVEPKNIWVTGNTAVDAILTTAKRVVENQAPATLPIQLRESIAAGARLIVVTGHRRESFGDDFESMCEALALISRQNPDIKIVYPVHLNPNVREPVFRILEKVENIFLIDPLPYDEFVWLLAKSHLVLSDSGGVQEEVPSLNKPVLVMREVTERPEGLEAGCSVLVGVNKASIVRGVSNLLDDQDLYEKMSSAPNPYGDGKASQRIADVILEIPKKND
jgi:UDP-N-acetylglucosamine 2-epimerase (non-hydrolysing)